MIPDFFNGIKYSGTQVAYYLVCKRKLWLFSHEIGFEKLSPEVEVGRVISELSFDRERLKEVDFQRAKLDFVRIRNSVVVHEVKKSRKLEFVHVWQVKFYIYVLRSLGVNCCEGRIHYPKLFKTVKVIFRDSDTEIIERFFNDIHKILGGNIPRAVRKSICKRCSYYEFCFS
jgi:CRISPR-associated exonuclease Cas4